MNPVDRDWQILMGPETDGSFLTIEGIADLDSHDFVSNLKPRYDNENLDTDCAGAVLDLADPLVQEPQGSSRDRSSTQQANTDDVP